MTGGITWTAPGEYYIEIEDTSQSVNLTTGDFSAVNTKPGPEGIGKFMLGFTITESGGNYALAAVKLYTSETDSVWSNGVAVTAETGTGTISTGALPAEIVTGVSATYIFDAQNYKLNTEGALGNLQIDNFGADDVAFIAAGKTLTLNNSFVATGGESGGTVRKIRWGGNLVLANGSLTFTNANSQDVSVEFDNSTVHEIDTITITGTGTIASTGAVNALISFFLSPSVHRHPHRWRAVHRPPRLLCCPIRTLCRYFLRLRLAFWSVLLLQQELPRHDKSRSHRLTVRPSSWHRRHPQWLLPRPSYRSARHGR